MTTPEISVLIPTYNRVSLLRRCLTSFDDQTDAPEFEVVVVDDGSSDGTPTALDELAATRPWLRWSSHTANRGPAAARNGAVTASRAPLLLFIDDDVIATPDLLRQHFRLHSADPRAKLAILGRVDWHPSLQVTPFMRWLDKSGLQFGYDTWLVEGPVRPPAAAFYTANLSIPRNLVVDAGGFDERFPFPAYEDIELATRLTERGLELDYRPQARAYHSRAIDLATFRRRMFNVGRSALLMGSVAPDFQFDDSGLRHRPSGLLSRVRARVLSDLSRNDARRSDYYWTTIAAAYQRGFRGGPAAAN